MTWSVAIRNSVRIPLVAVCAALALSAVRGADDDAPPFNIVFFLADDIGWADIGSYGNTYHETPHLDQLAADGVRFEQAYAAAPNCSSSRAGLLTGRWPARFGLTQYLPGFPARGRPLAPPPLPEGLPLEEVTLAEVLRAQGYATASIGKWHMGGEGFLPEQHGFDLNFGGGEYGRHRKLFAPYELPPIPANEGEYLTDRLTRRAMKFITTSRERPFFLFLSYYAVHEPIGGKPEYIEAFEAKAPGEHHGDPVYAAMLRSVDDSVGRLRAKLESLGLAERTALVFFSDNGGAEPHTSNHPLRAGKGWLYEGGIRDPLILHVPGRTPGGIVTSVPVVGIDLFPTLLALAQVEPPANDGVDLAPLFAGEGRLEPRDLYWHFPHYSGSGSTPSGAIRRGDLKLIEFFEDARTELYDLAADPGESDDLASERSDEASALRAALDEWRTAVGAAMPRVR
jgi:arylsulfatase A-like enzyme